MALQFVLQQPVMYDTPLLLARGLNITFSGNDNANNLSALNPNETVHFNLTSTISIVKTGTGRASWVWLKYRQSGIEPLISAMYYIFWTTLLVAGTLYLASKLALYIKRDPDFQRREMLKKKFKKTVLMSTPLIILPAFLGAWSWEKRFYMQNWKPADSTAYHGLDYAGRFVEKTYGKKALNDLSTLLLEDRANLTYESTQLSTMAWHHDVTIPSLRAAAIDIVAILVPLLTLLVLVAGVVGLFRMITGKGEREYDDKTMA